MHQKNDISERKPRTLRFGELGNGFKLSPLSYDYMYIPMHYKYMASNLRSRKTKLRENKEKWKLIFENFQKYQLHNAVERWFWVFLSAAFGNLQRNMSRSSLGHKMEIV